MQAKKGRLFMIWSLRLGPKHAAWAFLVLASKDVQDMYPLKFNGKNMFLSATLDPVPPRHVPAAIVTKASDEYEQDDLIDTVGEAAQLQFFHFNPKTLLMKEGIRAAAQERGVRGKCDLLVCVRELVPSCQKLPKTMLESD